MSSNNSGGTGPGRPFAPELGLIGEAWTLLSADFGGWLTSLVPFIVIYVATAILASLTGGILGILVLAVLPVYAATLAAYLMKLRTGQNADFNWVKDRAMQILVPSLIYGLIAGLAVDCGIILCIVPGLFLMGPMMIGMFQVGEGRSDFMGAFMDNVNLCKENAVPWIIFNLVCGIVGAFFITIPLVMIAYALAYRKMYD